MEGSYTEPGLRSSCAELSVVLGLQAAPRRLVCDAPARSWARQRAAVVVPVGDHAPEGAHREKVMEASLRVALVGEEALELYRQAAGVPLADADVLEVVGVALAAVVGVGDLILVERYQLAEVRGFVGLVVHRGQPHMRRMANGEGFCEGALKASGTFQLELQLHRSQAFNFAWGHLTAVTARRINWSCITWVFTLQTAALIRSKFPFTIVPIDL